MRMLVLGAGAIGGYYGARFLEGGTPVTFLVRPARAARLREEGLVVRSPLGDFVGAVPVVERLNGATFDVVLLACKTYDLDAAIEAIVPAVERGAIVLPLLNGLGVYDRLDARFGRARVMGGVAYIATTLEKSGEIVQQGTLDRFIVGARHPSQQALAANVHAALPAGRAVRELSTDIEQALWDKWAMLAAGAGITSLMRAPIGRIVGSTGGEASIRRIIDECLAVAASSNRALSVATADGIRARLLDGGSTWGASMMRDILQGAPRIETDLLGDLVRRAEGVGVPVPLLRAAHVHVQAYEAATA